MLYLPYVDNVFQYCIVLLGSFVMVFLFCYGDNLRLNGKVEFFLSKYMAFSRKWMAQDDIQINISVNISKQ